MAFNIVLVHPLIPSNTGNIGRLCVATNSVLHLIEPLGFELTDKQLKRAGLDYWQHLEVYTYANPAAFFEARSAQNFVMLSSNAGKPYWDHSFAGDDYLFFGSEEQGLPADMLQQYHGNCLTIPQFSQNVRCLNLANAVSIVLYEALRQTSGMPRHKKHLRQ